MSKAVVLPFVHSDESLRRWMADIAKVSGDVRYHPHAKQQMVKRKITPPQVLATLRRGQVVEPAHRDAHGDWKCTLELLVSGDLVKVVAAVKETAMGDKVLVVTAMK